jgi:crotonobetainyl-CoA:carnitine CoA-transferase CaiB-like acyl-CoA transferase
MLAVYSHAALGEVSTVGLPVKMSGFAPEYRPGPRLGGDSDDVLALAGYDPGEIAALRQRGAFGPLGAT